MKSCVLATELDQLIYIYYATVTFVAFTDSLIDET